MVDLVEISLWGIIGLISLTTSYLALKLYLKEKFVVYFSMFVSYIGGIIYGFSYMAGRLLELPNLIIMGYIGFMIFNFFSFAIFRQIIHPHRNYIPLQFIHFFFISGSLVLIFVFPPELTQSDIIYHQFVRVALGIMGLLQMVISLDFCIMGFKKIKDEKLSRKIILYALIYVVLGAFMGIMSIFVKNSQLPRYIFSVIGFIFLFFQSITLMIYPNQIFLFTINPQFLIISTQNGVPIYNKQFRSHVDSNLISGAFSVIGLIFTESFKEVRKISSIQFQNLTCYFDVHEQYFIVFVDEHKSKIIPSQLKIFGKRIKPQIDEILKNWRGDLTRFDFIEQEVKYCFEFLPEYLK